MLLLTARSAWGQHALGLEFRTGAMGPLSDAKDKDIGTSGGSIGPMGTLSAVWSDSLNATTELQFTGGYHYHSIGLWRKDIAVATSIHDSLRVRSGWLFLGFAPSWSLHANRRTWIRVSCDLLWPLHARATGFQRSASSLPSLNRTVDLDDRSIRYGQFTARIGVGVMRSFRLSARHALWFGPQVGLGVLDESSMTFTVRTL